MIYNSLRINGILHFEAENIRFSIHYFLVSECVHLCLMKETLFKSVVYVIFKIG